MLPVTLSSHAAVTFDVYARDAADADGRFADLIRASSTSTGTFVAMAVDRARWRRCCMAWLAGAFIRSLGDGDVRWWPGRGVRAARPSSTSSAGSVSIGISLIANADDTGATAWLALLTIVVVSRAVHVRRLRDRARGARASQAASAAARRIWLRRPGQCLMALTAFLIVGQLVIDRCSSQRIDDADGVFPGFFGALLLVQALIAYVSDCVLIALLLETPDEAATAPESATRE